MGLGLISACRLLSVLQVLLLLRVSLFHLLPLLPVLLFDWLISRWARLLREPPVVLLLLLLEALVVLFLPRVQLFLLLLVFLVQFRVSRVWRCGAWMRLNILSVRWSGGRNIVLYPRSRRVGASLRC